MKNYNYMIDEDIGGDVLKKNLKISDIYEETVKETSFMDKHEESNNEKIKKFYKSKITKFIRD